MKKTGENGEEVITIKKYANRRLYNTATSSYVTLDHLCQLVKDGKDFAVYDARSGEDITRSVLTQIIVEEEAKGQNLLPVSFLRQLISFYGDNMQWMVPGYLEHSMKSFTTNQEKLRDYMQQSFGGMFPFNSLEEMGKQNLNMIENAMKIFTPFPPGGDEQAGQRPANPAAEATNRDARESLDQLQKQIAELQAQLEKMSGKKD